MKQLIRSIVWFRQDLRIDDNTALIQACEQSEEIIPIFIFDPVILDQWPQYDPRLGFIVDALRELDTALRQHWSQLYVLYGDSVELISDLVSSLDVDWVFANRSYGWGSLIRDQELGQRLNVKGQKLQLYDDYLLVEPGAVEQRKVFTPFYKLWQKVEKRSPQLFDQQIITPDLELTHLDDVIHQVNPWVNSYWPVDDWKQILIDFDLDSYDQTRNGLDIIHGTSRLSAYVRFGLLSIRQVYQRAWWYDNDISLLSAWRQAYISELAWREFWQHIAHYFPETMVMGFQYKRRDIQWINDKSQFQAWCDGRTGYPIVDAAMIQLKTHNRMHWRARMIVASFLTKDLLIDWRWWEQHFARYLIDYDRNVNMWNRQRSASVWADPKPLRIFSPILQAQRFDASGEYIKHHLPQLIHESAHRIQDPLKYTLDYTVPIVDHVIAQRRAREVYKK